ncbi:MAG: hypothetical protein ACOVMP_08915, partial [Chthoniobacterales bacterium]
MNRDSRRAMNKIMPMTEVMTSWKAKKLTALPLPRRLERIGGNSVEQLQSGDDICVAVVIAL